MQFSTTTEVNYSQGINKKKKAVSGFFDISIG